MIRRLGCAILVLLCASGSSATGAILQAGDRLRITFTTADPPFVENKTPNVVSAALGYTERLEPYTLIAGALYDGETLLGISTADAHADLFCGYVGTYSYHPVPATWKSAGSPWDYHVGDPVTVDFTSLLNGTINGRIEFWINAGSFEFDPNDVYMSFTLATYANGGESVGPHPIVHSVEIIPGLGNLPPLPPDPSQCAGAPLPPQPPPPGTPPLPPPPPGTVPPPVVIEDEDLVLSTADLRAACEESHGNIVIMNQSATITNGSPAQEAIPTDCTIALGSDVSLNFDRVALLFAHPLKVQSQSKASVKLEQSMITAPAIEFHLPGTGSALMSVDSTLYASHNTMVVRLGHDGKMEIARQFSGQEHALSAYGTIDIETGSKFLGTFGDTSVRAVSGFKLNMNGSEGTFKVVDEVVLAASHGSIDITSSGLKGLVDIKSAALLVGEAVSIMLAGRESTVKLTQVDMGPFSAGAAWGGVTVEAGSTTGSYSKLEAAEVEVHGAASVTMQASPAGAGGLLKLEKSTVSATGKVFLKSGSRDRGEG